MFNNHISMIGKLNLSMSGPGIKVNKSFDVSKGAVYYGSLLAGYTFRNVPNLFITIAAGLGAGYGETSIKSSDSLTSEMGILNLGVPVHLAIQYFFTENVGIALNIVDTPSFGGILVNNINNLSTGFINVFTLKLGPAFKL